MKSQKNNLILLIFISGCILTHFVIIASDKLYLNQEIEGITVPNNPNAAEAKYKEASKNENSPTFYKCCTLENTFPAPDRNYIQCENVESDYCISAYNELRDAGQTPDLTHDQYYKYLNKMADESILNMPYQLDSEDYKNCTQSGGTSIKSTTVSGNFICATKDQSSKLAKLNDEAISKIKKAKANKKENQRIEGLTSEEYIDELKKKHNDDKNRPGRMMYVRCMYDKKNDGKECNDYCKNADPEAPRKYFYPETGRYCVSFQEHFTIYNKQDDEIRAIIEAENKVFCSSGGCQEACTRSINNVCKTAARYSHFVVTAKYLNYNICPKKRECISICTVQQSQFNLLKDCK